MTLQFRLEQDMQVIEAGGFFCKACVVGKPAAEQSPDPRYCQGCYEYLSEEAETLKAGGSRSRPPWLPKNSKDTPTKNMLEVPGDVQQFSRTINHPKIPSALYSVPDPPPANVLKRGRPTRELPEEINQWWADGMGSKSIASKLKREYGIKVHHSVIQRRFSPKHRQKHINEKMREP